MRAAWANFEPQATVAEQEEFQLRRYLGLLWQGKWIILPITTVAMGGVIAFNRQKLPPTPPYGRFCVSSLWR